ncbi:toll/interleukin-1 receptor domain-containing protein [Roseomonas sp. GCM10028921]
MGHRVFVSHVNGDPDTDAVLNKICGALSGAGLDVLVDTERLRPGALWRQEIYAWLGLCHGALLLLSRRAIDDPAKYWVARETALLVWRRALDPSLRIVPLLLSGVRREELSSGRFADLQLQEIQCVTAGEDLGETVRRVLEGLRPVPGTRIGVATTPLDQLAAQMAARLGGFGPDALHAAVGRLGLDLGAWRPAEDARRELAVALLCAQLEDAAGALEVLAGYGGPAARAELAEVAQVIGANWVDPEAARWLALDGAGTGAVLNATTQFAAECYVQRACGLPPASRWTVVPLTGVTGEEAEVELRAEVEAALERVLPLKPDSFGPPPAVLRHRLLERRRRSGNPTFLLARLPPDPASFVATLRAAFPWASILLLGGELEEDETEALARYCRILRPLIEDGADLDARTRLDDLLLQLAPQT